MLTLRNAIAIPVTALCLVLASCGISTRTSIPGRDGIRAAINRSAAAGLQTVELAALARSWSSDWIVIGAKTEPTYVEHIRISRRGDRFTLDADANGEQFGRIELSVDSRGGVAVVACPPRVSCGAHPNGFLATVLVLAAARRGRLTGSAPVLGYAGRAVACIPGELLAGPGAPADTAIHADGTSAVDLDPCLDILTGAVLAQRSRHDRTFTGPTLDEGTLIVRDLTTDACQGRFRITPSTSMSMPPCPGVDT